MATAELDLAGFDTADDLRRPREPVTGLYHVLCTAVETDALRKTFLAHFRVLSGLPVDQAGCEFTQLFPYSVSRSSTSAGRERRQLILLALCTGLIRPDDLGKRVLVDWELLCGRQCVLGVKSGRNAGVDADGNDSAATTARIHGLRIFSLKDPAVAHVPKDWELLSLPAELPVSAVPIVPA